MTRKPRWWWIHKGIQDAKKKPCMIGDPPRATAKTRCALSAPRVLPPSSALVSPIDAKTAALLVQSQALADVPQSRV